MTGKIALASFVSFVISSSCLVLAGCGSSSEQPPAAERSAAAGKPASAERAGRDAAAEPADGGADAAVEPEPEDERPNIVVVLIDTLRPDFLGFYGFRYETAPFLASFAQDAVVFERARSASSWTAPATASVFTSLYPPQHGVVQGYKAHRGIVAQRGGDAEKLELNRIPDEATTLPELLSEAGYRTYGAAANINICELLGFESGFDRFERHERAPAEELRGILEGWANEMLSGEEPFFLYLHFNDVHSPYEHHKEHYQAPLGSGKRPGETLFAADYRSEIGYLDGELAEVHDILEPASDETIFIYLSDHGEEFDEHGSTGHGPTLYTELTHVLMLAGGPGLGAGRVEETVSLVDVLPTVAELAGVEPEAGWEGRSLAPLLLEGDARADDLRERLRERPVFAHRMFSSYRNLARWALMQDDWKLISSWGESYELFDHATDPNEKDDIERSQRKAFKALEARLEEFVERMRQQEDRSRKVAVQLDEELLERLAELGYVGDENLDVGEVARGDKDEELGD